MQIPTLRIELDGMRLGMVQALMSHNREIEQAVEHALTNFDMEADVRRAVQNEVPKILQRVIQDAARNALSHPTVQARINTLVMAAITESLQEPQQTP